MLKFSNLIGAAVANCSEAMEADTISKNGRSLKSQMSRGNFLRTLTKGIILVLLVTQFSCTVDKVLVQNENPEWWLPILEKHNLKLGAYNNLGNVFEMGMEGNSINNGICTLKGAIVLIKYNDRYVLIEADTIYHNIQEGVFNVISGVGKVYNTNSELPDVTHENLTKVTIGKQKFEFASENRTSRLN